VAFPINSLRKEMVEIRRILNLPKATKQATAKRVSEKISSKEQPIPFASLGFLELHLKNHKGNLRRGYESASHKS